MSDLIYIRNGSWPFQRLARLAFVSNVDRPMGLMQTYQGSFSLAKTDPSVGHVQQGRMVEMLSTDGLDPWIGWLQRPKYDSEAGVITVGCDDVATKLGERTTEIASVHSGSAGAIARNLLFAANSRNSFGLLWDTFSDIGAPVVELDAGATSLLDALDKLADASGEEWWIRSEAAPDSLSFYLRWGQRRGFDASQTVYLRAGREISSLSYTRGGVDQAESVFVVGGSGSLLERSVVARGTANPERISDISVTVQAAHEAYRRSVSLPPALAAERLIAAPRESSQAALALAAETRLEGETNTSEEISFTVNEYADWSLLKPGNTVTILFNDPVHGVTQRTPRIWEIRPRDGTLEVQCFKQSWGVLAQLQQHGQAISELELA